MKKMKKFIKHKNFKPPILNPRYKIYGTGKRIYIMDQREYSSAVFLTSTGKLISADGSTNSDWAGYFPSKKAASQFLDKMGASYV